MNVVSLVGFLTKDPEFKLAGETKVCEMRLAQSDGHKDSPLYINVTAFDRQAETCASYLEKGRPVAVVGRLRFRQWSSGGTKHSEICVIADRVQFLPGGSRRPGRAGAETDAPAAA